MLAALWSLGSSIGSSRSGQSEADQAFISFTTPWSFELDDLKNKTKQNKLSISTEILFLALTGTTSMYGVPSVYQAPPVPRLSCGEADSSEVSIAQAFSSPGEGKTSLHFATESITRFSGKHLFFFSDFKDLF